MVWCNSFRVHVRLTIAQLCHIHSWQCISRQILVEATFAKAKYSWMVVAAPQLNTADVSMSGA